MQHEQPRAVGESVGTRMVFQLSMVMPPHAQSAPPMPTEGGNHMWAMTALANSEHFTFFAPSMSRAKS